MASWKRCPSPCIPFPALRTGHAWAVIWKRSMNCTNNVSKKEKGTVRTPTVSMRSASKELQGPSAVFAFRITIIKSTKAV
mmetsp:Transcript_29721/g.47983  ORF Transcript_29721/g.47983 Transcript_29721/m.47983 type:complete len:80 (-) Transcript_29721:253-492(-)